MAGDVRRVTLRLDADHPIFEIPERQRGSWARERLDVGQLLASIEARLIAIESRLAFGAVVAPPPGPPALPRQIDVAAFLGGFE